jgi:CDP-diacylglycerol--glycerol-3-phosphate 3-phosphatidyltransferase
MPAPFPDHGYTLILVMMVVVVGAAYVVRMLARGAARHDRTAKIGGSFLVSQGVLDWWYWMMRPVARGMVAIGLSANAVTWLALVLGLGAGVAAAYGRFGLVLWLGVMSALFDILDGWVARLTDKCSDAGEVLDAAVDRYTEFALLGGLCIFYRENVAILSLTLLAMLGSFLISYSTAKAEAMNVVPPRGTMRRHERAVYLLTGAGLSSLTIAWFEPQRFIKPFGVPMVLGLGIVALVANVSAARRFAAISRAVRARELAAQKSTLAAEDESAEAGAGVEPREAE